jgi:plasmid maintenance system antidote protein VapI
MTDEKKKKKKKKSQRKRKGITETKNVGWKESGKFDGKNRKTRQEMVGLGQKKTEQKQMADENKKKKSCFDNHKNRTFGENQLRKYSADGVKSVLTVADKCAIFACKARIADAAGSKVIHRTRATIRAIVQTNWSLTIDATVRRITQTCGQSAAFFENTNTMLPAIIWTQQIAATIAIKVVITTTNATDTVAMSVAMLT